MTSASPVAGAVKEKTTFYWASIAGADPEPVEVTEVNGRPAVLTIGCPDPFYLDEKPCAVRLATAVFEPGDSSRKLLDFKNPTPILRPELADKDGARAIADYYHGKPSAQHSWRGAR